MLRQLPAFGKDCFEGIAKDAVIWYPADNLTWSADSGIGAGYSGSKEGTFGVNDSIPRGQVVTFLYRQIGG